jgi:hypothetical protein
VMRAHPNLRNVNFDWNDKVKSVRVEIDQERARALGVSSQDVALMLQGWLVGATVTQYREADQLIDVVWRAGPGRGEIGCGSAHLNRLPDLDIVSASGRHIPLAQVAKPGAGAGRGPDLAPRPPADYHGTRRRHRCHAAGPPSRRRSMRSCWSCVPSCPPASASNSAVRPRSRPRARTRSRRLCP